MRAKTLGTVVQEAFADYVRDFLARNEGEDGETFEVIHDTILLAIANDYVLDIADKVELLLSLIHI